MMTAVVVAFSMVEVGARKEELVTATDDILVSLCAFVEVELPERKSETLSVGASDEITAAVVVAFSRVEVGERKAEVVAATDVRVASLCNIVDVAAACTWTVLIDACPSTKVVLVSSKLETVVVVTWTCSVSVVVVAAAV